MPYSKTNHPPKKSDALSNRDVSVMDMAVIRDDLFSHPLPDKPTVEQVLQHALFLFQSEASAFNWLRTHCPALGKTPAEFMNTPKGRDHVLRVLFGAYHGTYQ